MQDPDRKNILEKAWYSLDSIFAKSPEFMGNLMLVLVLASLLMGLLAKALLSPQDIGIWGSEGGNLMQFIEE